MTSGTVSCSQFSLEPGLRNQEGEKGVHEGKEVEEVGSSRIVYRGCKQVSEVPGSPCGQERESDTCCLLLPPLSLPFSLFSLLKTSCALSCTVRCQAKALTPGLHTRNPSSRMSPHQAIETLARNRQICPDSPRILSLLFQ